MSVPSGPTPARASEPDEARTASEEEGGDTCSERSTCMHATSAAKSEKTMNDALEEASTEKVDRFKSGVQHEEAGTPKGGGSKPTKTPPEETRNTAATVKLKRTHRCVRLWPTRLSKCFLLYRRDNVENNVASIE